MKESEITALAREYAEEIVKAKGLTGKDRDMLIDAICSNIERFLPWLLRRYCLVEKSKLEKLDIAFRAKHYDMVVLNQGDVESLFPEIGKEVEE